MAVLLLVLSEQTFELSRNLNVRKMLSIQGMVLIQYCTVRKYVHVFIFFKKLGIPFCTAPVPVYQFICPVNTIMKSFEIYLTKNLHLFRCTYVRTSFITYAVFFFLFLKFQLPYRLTFFIRQFLYRATFWYMTYFCEE